MRTIKPQLVVCESTQENYAANPQLNIFNQIKTANAFKKPMKITIAISAFHKKRDKSNYLKTIL